MDLSVNTVSFSRWDPYSILKSSVLEVEQESDLSSPLLGVVFGGKCPTCFCTKHECPGHFGSLRLSEPVYHISWINHLLRLLKKKKGKFAWNKHKACLTCDGKIYPASNLFSIMENPPVIAVLPIPPPHVRPPLFVDGESKGENDVTYRLQNIIRKNRALHKLKTCKRPPDVINQAREALQNAVTGYINHEKLGPSRRVRNKREYASLESRIKKKGGRIRSNLMGKRADYTARCVITGDDSLKMNELGVPISVAKTLTVPVKVTDYTRESLQDMLDSNKVKYVTRKDGSRSSKRVILEVGDTVERYLKDGDIVLFNRQPSLHKFSLMAHHVRILPHSTFRFNVAATSPYNADFDGDEMNLHVPQTIMAQAEAKEIMDVKHNIISAQGNCPVIGLIQDSLLGIYLLSGATLKRHEAMQVAQTPCGLTGKEIISTALPDLNYERNGVKIIRGRFLEGRLTKKDVGKSNGSLVHIVYNDFGADACIEFMQALQGFAHRYLSIRGFTIGISDLIRSKEATKICIEERKKAFEEAKHLEDPNNRLNSCRAIMGRAVIKDMTEKNNFYAMVHSGSKGSLVNLTQVQACLGQMNVQGGRTPLQWRERTATEFKRGENGPLSRGFVSHSYVEGLSPFEMYSHSMSGREGLIDTAIKTAQTGYTERKLMKCLENITIHTDGTVRDRDQVLQFQYGDDGFDAAKIETQRLKPLPGARSEDLDMLNAESYHFPVPIHRIVRKIELFGGVTMICGPPIHFTDNRLLQAFINVHTPTMTQSTAYRFETMIKTCLERANISPGECVGALAAQSIGERTTQCTLNSVDYFEWIVIQGFPKDGTIGEIVDSIMLEQGYENKNNSHVTEVTGLKAFTVDENGTTSWQNITHVTRHPPRFYKGSNLLVKITLTSGRTLTASRAKSFLILKNKKIIPIDGLDIKPGDQVPVLLYNTQKNRGFRNLGYFLGAYYACGYLKENAIYFPESALAHFRKQLKPYNPVYVRENDQVKILCARLYYMVKNIGKFPSIILQGSAESRLAFCRAFMKIKGEEEEGFLMVKANRYMRDGIAFMLRGLGIEARVSKPGLLLDPINHQQLFGDVTEYKGVVFEEIVSVEHIESSKMYVYDLTVEGTKNMCALNGIACRDTFHFAGIGSKNVTLGIPRLREILGVSKFPKTPLTTLSDTAALSMKYDNIKDITMPMTSKDTIDNYWDFPDGDLTKDQVYEKWGEPKRLVLRAGREILDMFEYAAYQDYSDRIVVDAFGDILEERGVKGADWCKLVQGKVETTLQDLHKIMQVCDDLVDLYTNDIYKMQCTFGIECARTCIIIEIRKILNFYGIYINSRHLLVLADAMTVTGSLTPLSRHGLKKSKCSALKRCTFEEVVTVLHEAALKEEVDMVDGVSPCILTGKVAKIGSNCVEVLKDHVVEKKYQQPRPSEEEGVDMWMPIPILCPQPSSPTYAPNSPTYDP